MKKYVLAVVIGCLTACSGPSSGDQEKLVGGPHYFGSFESLKHRPELPLDPLDEQQLRDRRARGESYVVAFYGPYGRLTSIEAKQNDSTLWKSQYTYRPNGTVATGETTHDAGRKVYEFDDSGVQVRETTYDKQGKELR